MKKVVVEFPEFDRSMRLYTLELAEEWKACTRCTDLSKSRTKFVYGSGHPDADLMIIGEGPGNDEDYYGVPFIGESGGLLNQLLIINDMTREDVFVDNLVPCRPLSEDIARETVRTPTRAEISNCLERLHETIRQVDPLLIVTMGATALKTLTGDNSLSINKVRGEVFTIRVPGVFKMIEYPVVACMHPAYILRNPSDAKHSPKWYLVEDFTFAIKLLQLARKCYKTEVNNE